MSSHDAGDWVRQGTPRGTGWEDDQSEYGTTLEPAEWDDHAAEQAVPVERPQSRPRPRPATHAAPVIQPRSQGPARTPQPDQATEPTARVELEPGEPLAEEDLETTRVRLFDESPAGAAPERQAMPERSVPQRPAATHESQLPQRSAVTPSPQNPQRQVAVDPYVEEPQPAPTEEIRAAMTKAESPQRLSQETQSTTPSASVAAQRLGGAPDPEISPRAGGQSQVPQRSALPQTAASEPEEQPTSVTPPGQESPLVEETVVSGRSPEAPAALYREGEGAFEPSQGESPIEATSVQPQVVAGAGAPTPAPTPPPAEEVEEELRLQEQLAAERAARDERLGVVKTSPANEIRTPPAPERPTTDRPLASFGLFFLRLVTAGILGIIAYQGLTNIDGAAEVLGRTVLPQPRLIAWIGGFTLITLALLLVVGALQRVVGALLLVFSVLSLVFVRWGRFSPFVSGVEGFIGDRDLLLGAVGLLLLCLGGGGWGIDAAFRRSREAAKAERG